MKAKRKMGMEQRRRRCRGGTLSFRQHVILPILKAIQKVLGGRGLSATAAAAKKGVQKSSLLALRAARAAIKNAGRCRRIHVPHIIPFGRGGKQSGGILPLIPILTGPSALGSLAHGASAVAETIMDLKNAQRKLEEDRPHNMQEIGKKGSSLYLRRKQR